MPVITGLTDPILVKLYHQGLTDRQIADMYGITPQAVSKRRVRLNLIRKPVVRAVNEGLKARWDIRATRGDDSHHNEHHARMLKVYLRKQLGDTKLSPKQLAEVAVWVRERQDNDDVLCYDPDTPKGWYLRARRPQDGRRVIDWPPSIPFPSEAFRRALDLHPRDPIQESS